jgi:hypothetical protein
MGRQLADNVEGAPSIRTFAMISPTSHYGQLGRMTCNISGAGRQFLSQLIEDQKRKVSGLTPSYLYRRRKLK